MFFIYINKHSLSFDSYQLRRDKEVVLDLKELKFN
jgi:hypothetical protein